MRDCSSRLEDCDHLCCEVEQPRLTCCNNEVDSSVGCAGEGDDVVDPEVAEGGDEGHGACQHCSKDQGPCPAIIL